MKEWRADRIRENEFRSMGLILYWKISTEDVYLTESWEP